MLTCVRWYVAYPLRHRQVNFLESARVKPMRQMLEMRISVKDGAAIHDPVSFEIINKICASYYPAFLRSANRSRFTPENRFNYFGLRLARTP